MSLADLIQRKKTATVLSSATAISAISAIVEPFPADIQPRIATIATIAVATPARDKILLRPHGGRDLPHYCKPGECWCSGKLQSSNYPVDCIRINCEYHLA